MENGIVRSIHSVLAVNISRHQKLVVSRLHRGDLVHRSVWPQNSLGVLVVSVRWATRNVVFGNEKQIKAVIRLNYRVKLRNQVPFTIGQVEIADLLRLEKLIDTRNENL